MFDIAPSEFFIVALVALIVIGPKDLPKAMRVVGYWVGRARGVARQFRSGFDNMVREAELAEMEKKWADENARILAEHPAGAVVEASASTYDAAAAGEAGTASSDDAASSRAREPQMVEKPVVAPAAADAVADPDAKVGS